MIGPLSDSATAAALRRIESTSSVTDAAVSVTRSRLPTGPLWWEPRPSHMSHSRTLTFMVSTSASSWK